MVRLLDTQMPVQDFRLGLQFFRNALVDNVPGCNHIHVIRHLHGETKILLHQENGMSLFPDTPHNLADLADQLRPFDVVVDAVGGTGVRGALRGAMAAAVEAINAAGRPTVAIDIPTGLDCDTGTALGPAVRAELTVTFVARKKGFDGTGAADYTGRVVVADIGIPPEIITGITSRRDQ